MLTIIQPYAETPLGLARFNENCRFPHLKGTPLMRKESDIRAFRNTPIPGNETRMATQQYSSPQRRTTNAAAHQQTAQQWATLNQPLELTEHPSQTVFLETFTLRITEVERKSQKTLDLLLDRMKSLETRDRRRNRPCQ